MPIQEQDTQPAKSRTMTSRIAGAMKEGAKRAPIEIALEEGQKLVVQELLRGFKGSRTEKAGARKFLVWFFSSPAGQVAIAGAISGSAPLIAGLVGKDGPVVQTVSDEFAARAATITTKEGMKFALRQLRPLLSIFTRLFDSMAPDDESAPSRALNEGGAHGTVFNMAGEKVGARIG